MTVTVKVYLNADSYDICIEDGIFSTAGEYLSRLLPSKRVCIVTDETVAKLYLVEMMKTLEASGFSCCPPIILPAGEASKNFKQLQNITDKILSYKLDRKSTLIALGGGVVGDIAGFAAAIALRGINFVQMPTTLLAQVDSSVGGKTGINTKYGKNLVGAFYQPRVVLIDTATLKTLPERELRAGYAEILKYALIRDPEFFEWLEATGAQKIMAREPSALSRAIEESCHAKAAIVSEDEKEQKDIRALLNLGHSFGHAMEAIGGYDGRILHGEAVGIGLELAFAFSRHLEICPEEDLNRVKEHVRAAGLMTEPPFKVSGKGLLEKMRGDKKNKDGKITLVLVKGIGGAFVERNIPEKTLQDFLEERFG